MKCVDIEDARGAAAVLSTALIAPIGPDTTATELMVMRWFAAGHEMLWIPIHDVVDDIEAAKVKAQHFGEPRLIRAAKDLYALPISIRGWLFPAHQDDTDVICVRLDRSELGFGQLLHPVTGQRLSWRYHTVADILWPNAVVTQQIGQ